MQGSHARLHCSGKHSHDRAEKVDCVLFSGGWTSVVRKKKGEQIRKRMKEEKFNFESHFEVNKIRQRCVGGKSTC